jgi:hypothetical protein
MSLMGALLTALASYALVRLHQGNNTSGRASNPMVEKITTYFPFNFSDSLDPRAVLTVGDQVASEHLFGAHIRETVKSGLQPVYSELTFKSDSATVEIRPRFPLLFSNGKALSLSDVCKAITQSFDSSYHAEYKSILKSIRCDEPSGKIELKFSALPVNLRFLFTLPDLGIYSIDHLPIRDNASDWTTGPYKIVSRSRDKIELAINPNYPTELRANSVPRVDLIRYGADQSQALVSRADPKINHAIYFYGYAISKEDLDSLKSKGYQIEIFPTEWMIYGGAKGGISKVDRSIFASAVRHIRESGIVQKYSGREAYSIAPQDREYGLKSATEPELQKGPLSHDYELLTMKSWAELPFFKELISEIIKVIPNLHLKLLDPNEFSRLYESRSEFILSPIGISPADPLSHLSFLSSVYPDFEKVVTKDEIAKLAVIDNYQDFVFKVKEVETKVVSSGTIFPIGHFPGIVAVRSDFQRDENLSFGWGIQAWTFRVH